MDVESVPIEYRAGDNPIFSKIKMPEIRKGSNLVMKKGVFADAAATWEWYPEIEGNTIKRKTMTISLLDEDRKPTMVWKIHNAFPVKIQGLNPGEKDVAVESIEMAYEELTIENS